MSRYLSAEEAKEELLDQLGPRLGPAFHELQAELTWLHIKWRQYRVLFGTKSERLELVNRAGGVFFHVVQDVLWEDTLLHLARLTDAVGRRGQQRLTVRHLPTLVDSPGLRDSLEGLVNLAIEHCQFARDWRNRRIAHRDLAHALDPSAVPLSPASRQSVEAALESLRNVLNFINKHLRDTEMVFTFTDHPGDAEHLLYVLRDGLDAEERRMADLREGRLPPEEWGPPRPV